MVQVSILCLPELETLFPCLGDCYCSCLQGNITALWAVKRSLDPRKYWRCWGTTVLAEHLEAHIAKKVIQMILRAFLAIQMRVGLSLNSQSVISGSKEALVKFQILCPCYLSFFRKRSNAIFLQQNLSFILLNGWKFLFWFFSPEKSSTWGRYALQSSFILSSPWYAPCICCTYFIFSFHLPCCFTKCQ